MSGLVCESSSLKHSVPLPRLGIVGAVGFVISYFIDIQLFTLNFSGLAFQRFSVSGGGMWVSPSFLYTYNLLIIN